MVSWLLLLALAEVPSYELKPLAMPEPVNIGDSILFSVEGFNPGERTAEDLRVSLPEKPTKKDKGGAWFIYEEVRLNPGLILRATPVKEGPNTLSPVEIRDNLGQLLATTEPFTITVAQLAPPADPKKGALKLVPPIGLNFPFWIRVLVLALIFITLLGLVVGVIVFFKRRNPVVIETIVAAPPKPSHELAMADLGELETLGLWKKGHYKEHYFRLSEILKAYLGARFQFDALESTTQELLANLSQRKVEPALFEKVKAMMVEMDSVKFADRIPNEGEPQGAIHETRTLVSSTRSNT